METGVLSVSDVWRTVPRKLVWIYLFVVNLEVTDVMSEICVYKHNKHNLITNRDDYVLTTKDCQWGCCYNTDSPCCTAPISLIVGVTLGGVLIFAVIVAVVCCCCVCRTSQGTAAQRRGGQSRSDLEHPAPSSNQNSSVVFHSETSGCVDIPAYLRYDDFPPSYEEVMRGETNHAFKPETS